MRTDLMHYLYFYRHTASSPKLNGARRLDGPYALHYTVTHIQNLSPFTHSGSRMCSEIHVSNRAPFIKLPSLHHNLRVLSPAVPIPFPSRQLLAGSSSVPLQPPSFIITILSRPLFSRFLHTDTSSNQHINHSIQSTIPQSAITLILLENKCMIH